MKPSIFREKNLNGSEKKNLILILQYLNLRTFILAIRSISMLEGGAFLTYVNRKNTL
jgi:hypothetical protein